MHMRTALAGMLALILAAPAAAQEQLTLQRLFASADFRPQGLPAVRWMRDGQRYAYVVSEGGHTSLVAEDARSGRRTVLVDGTRLIPAGSQSPISIEDYRWSADERKLLIYTRSQPVWRQNTKGHYYVFDLAIGRLTPVSTASGWQQFAKLSPDASRVGFVRDNDLFVTDLATGRETRLTHDGSEEVINGTFDWVYEEELGLQDGWRWSPDGTQIAFWRIDQSAVRNFFWMIDTDSSYSRPVSLRYPKAGGANPTARIGVVSAAGGEVRWMDTGSAGEQYLARMEWHPAGGQLMIQRLRRHQNDLDVLLADTRTGATRGVFSDRDAAWVEVDEDFAWLNGGRQFLFSSERDGFNHLYVVDAATGSARQLTRGGWEVTRLVAVDERGGWVYFAAREAGPQETHLYRIRLNGTGLRRITTEHGTHNAAIAEGSPYFLDVHSQAGVPPTIRLFTTDGRAVRVLVDNARVRGNLEALHLRLPEFTTIPGADGTPLQASVIRPPDFDPSRRYPVLMYVYGGPGSQTVVDAWGGSRYLWHQLLAQRGYVVVTVDNHGTGGRGSAFKKSTYLRLGIQETADQVAAARWLARQPWVDGDRLGIWGWSYGGFMTASVMLAPDSPFRAGIAVAPVTDWHLYDSIYTERFMGMPEENQEGYRITAPVRNAANLRGRFLLIHGTGDDNVHFQNSVQLAGALQAAGRQFQMMAYPNRNHSISGGNTSLHLYTLMTEWVVQNL
jgi:dipeptidyl-peptidase 4